MRGDTLIFAISQKLTKKLRNNVCFSGKFCQNGFSRPEETREICKNVARKRLSRVAQLGALNANCV